MKLKKDRLIDKWYRLDNSAVIYPMSITPTSQSLFRLTAEMHKHIDEEFLLSAVKNILPRFPSFAVQLRSGFFRHYFDHNDLEPVIRRDSGNLFQKIDFFTNNRYLFRVSYFNNKIFVDFFHALCDGHSAVEFMKALIYQYTVEEGNPPPADGSVKLGTDPPLPEELDDSFLTYHKKYELFGGVIGKLAGSPAYQIKGKRFINLGYGLIEGYIDTPPLLALARKYGVSVTVLVAANALLSIAETHIKGTQNDKPTVMIPVDLRNFFPSKSLKNFTSLVRCSVDTANTEPTLEAYSRVIKEQLEEGLNADSLREKLSLSAFMGVKWYMKILPLFLKSFFIRMGKFLSFKTTQTLIMSNLGVVKMPKGMESHMKKFTFNSNVSKKAPINIGVVSYNNITTVSFTRALVSTEIEKRFFKRFADLGLTIEIASNLREMKGKFSF